jgi:hypothetical protein
MILSEKHAGKSKKGDCMKKSMFLSISLVTCLTASALALEAPAVPPKHPEIPAAASSPAPSVSAPAAADPVVPAAAPAADVPLAGKVVQTMNAGGYSYIYIEQADGSKKWVAVTQIAVKVGDQMSFKPGMEMGRFESKALNRSFDSIIFSEGVISGGSTGPVLDPGKNQGVSPGSEGALKDKAAKISVTKATGTNAATVAEAFAKSAKLNKKTVVIRGQVVKISSGIMGKNWIHIQDGTGSEKKKTHNLVCTSKTDIADVGDVVTITGTLIKDRDFGAGYKYPVIIEDSTITK